MSITMNETNWLFGEHPKAQARLRLFCFPYAGGGASFYYSWLKQERPAGIDLCPVQLPGRENRFSEQAFLSMPPLVEELAVALRPYLDRPFAFFGHSMGSVIAFELARVLRREYGLMPQYLFVSGRRAPHVPEPNPNIYKMPENQFIEEISSYNGAPMAVMENAELREMFVRILRADFTICGTYCYRDDAPLDCPIAAFGGLNDIKTPRTELSAWYEHTERDFSLQMFPGDHFYLRNVQSALLEQIFARLVPLLT